MSVTLKKNLTADQKAFINLLLSNCGPVVSRKQIIEVAKSNNVEFPWWLLRQPFKSFRARRGHYNLETILAADAAVGTQTPVATVASTETPSVSA